LKRLSKKTQEEYQEPLNNKKQPEVVIEMDTNYNLKVIEKKDLT